MGIVFQLLPLLQFDAALLRSLFPVWTQNWSDMFAVILKSLAQLKKYWEAKTADKSNGETQSLWNSMITASLLR